MMWGPDIDSRIPFCVDSDHGLSLGYRLKVVSTSPYADSSIRIAQHEMDALLNDQIGCEGLCATWPERRLTVLAINFSETKDWAVKRIIELIVHEVSHFVDETFERAHISTVDTELRAYYNDWIVGKVLCKFPVFADLTLPEDKKAQSD